MDQNRLQQKRRKRQAKRKGAQVRARRQVIAETEARNMGPKKKLVIPTGLTVPKAQSGLLGRLFGGTQVTPDQMDTEPAQIVRGEPS